MFTQSQSLTTLGSRDGFVDLNAATLTDHFSERRLDDASSDVFRTCAKSSATGDANDHLVVIHVDELDGARILFEQRIENLVDELLECLAHPQSMRN